MEGHPLSAMLDLSVSLRIAEIEARGGPQEEEFTRARAASQLLAEKGDVLLFGSKTKGEAGRIFNEVAAAVAVMAFCPGGVEVFGSRYIGGNQMSDGNEGQLQLDTMPNWLKGAAPEPAATPATPPPDPAAAWLAPDDRTAPEPGELPAEVAGQLGDRANMTGAEMTELAKTGLATAWAGPSVGQPIRGGPDPDPAPIREPGDDPAPDDQPGEDEEGEGVDPRVDTIAQGLLLFKRLWFWPAGTQNEADAATEFAEFIVDLADEFKPKASPDGNKPQ